MDLPLYQVDAFVTDRPLSGSPAAIVPLATWIDEPIMQGIAAENNLSETAFLVPEGDGHRIRWFTPTIEVDLCGHATLAAAWVLFEKLQHTGSVAHLHSASGDLHVSRRNDGLVLDFPSRPATEVCPESRRETIRRAMGSEPEHILKSTRDWLIVFNDPETIRRLKPDHAVLAAFTGQGFIVTAPAVGEYDFVFRYFAPALGLNEDPATGSVQSTLVPYWADRLGKTRLSARQHSTRGAEFQLELSQEGDRVTIAGRCRPYMEGTIHV